MTKLKFLKLFLLLAFITTYHLPLTTHQLFAQDKIVAVVNNDVITQKDLNDFINFIRMQLSQEFKGAQLENKIQSIKSDLLNKLVDDRLILQEAKKNNIKIDENMVTAKIEEAKKNYASDREFQEALAQQGLIQADIELRMREQLLTYNIIDTKIRSKITINPGEVTEFYEKNIKEFQTPEEREFESIKITDKNLTEEIFNNLKNGQDFSDTAKRYSLVVDRISAKQGQELKEDIENVLFKLNLNEVSRPIKIQDNFYIFKLVNIVLSRQQVLSEVQNTIYAFLFEKKMQEELTKWLAELKKNAYIKIFPD